MFTGEVPLPLALKRAPLGSVEARRWPPEVDRRTKSARCGSHGEMGCCNRYESGREFISKLDFTCAGPIADLAAPAYRGV